MILSEMAIHNVRSVQALLRMKLAPGLNLIQGRNGSGKTTLVDTLFALLTPTGEQTEILSGQSGIIYEAQDGFTYRFVRDFSKRKASLARRDESGKFIPLNQDEGWILSFVLGDFKGFSMGDLREAAVVDKASMPSSRGRTAGPPAVSEASAATVVSAPRPVLSPEEREQKEARLEELREQLTHVDEVAALEDRLAEWQGKISDLNRSLKLYSEKGETINELSMKNRGFETLWPLPDGYDQLLARFDELGAEFGKNIEAIEEEHVELTAELAAVPNQPVFQTPFFLSGAVILVVSFLLPAVMDISGMIQRLFFVPLAVGIGLIGFSVIRDFSRSAKRKTLNARLQALLNQRDLAEISFDQNSREGRELLQKAGCSTSEAFHKKVAAYEQFLVQKKVLEAERDRAIEGKSTDQIQREITELTDRVREMESRIASLTARQSDLYLVEEEIRRLENELSEASQPEEPATFSPSPAVEEPAPSAEGFDFLIPATVRNLLRRESIAPGQPSGRETLADRITRCLARFPQAGALTVEVDENLSVRISDKEGGLLSPSRSSSSLMDQVSFVLQTVLRGHLLHSLRFPMLLDDPLTSLDSENQATALDILREIAQTNQVLWLTSTAHLLKEGEGSNTLPPPAA
jgi:energy-coupling factor transporter ATP-binding protein EcfA2